MRGDADVVTRDPLNAHTPWDALAAPRTPVGAFYTRNNFPIPRLDPAAWRLRMGARAWTLADLRALPRVEREVVMECAGNGRTRFDPAAEGTPWRDRAVANARFAGARLADVLAAAPPPPGTVEVLFRGADAGTAAGRPMRFERSLPLDVAMRDDTLLAYEMEGAPLAPEHGAPVRLLVPRWYGVASVKWVVEMDYLARPFEGHFQKERYVYERARGSPDARPVREMRVKSLVVAPAEGARVAAGRATSVRGWAWSGAAPVARVEISVDGGRTWKDAALESSAGETAWRGFALAWTPPPGRHVILSRAHDASGARQPDAPEWNVHGYAYNAPIPVAVDAA